MTSFDLFAPDAAPTLLLLGARVSGLALVAPVFSARPVPMMVRSGLVVLFVILLLPVVGHSGGAPPAATPAAVVGEVVVGFVVGLGAALLVGAAEMAGELLSIQIGLQGSAIVDPIQLQNTTALGQFMQLFSLALLLSLDAHVVMLESVATSLRLAPVGDPIAAAESFWNIATLGASLFALGLQFAAPVIAIVLITNVALSVLSRAAPQLNIIALAFPVQILIGLMTLVALIPVLGTLFLSWESVYDGFVTQALPGLFERR
ncbi:MAG: flagellar biosynthetic protein FliR [Gemmatimonadota bacterium]